MTYASKSRVPVDRSRSEIERLLAKHGADQFINGWEADRAMIGFRMNGRYVRLTIPLKGGRNKEATAQLTRSRWRALVLILKAKLEAIEIGVVTFDEEFLANIVMPNNQTIGRQLLPQVDKAYASGKMPTCLLEAP